MRRLVEILCSLAVVFATASPLVAVSKQENVVTVVNEVKVTGSEPTSLSGPINPDEEDEEDESKYFFARLGPYFESTYDSLNKQLIRGKDSSDVKENIKFASGLLTTLQTKNSIMDRTRIAALEQLLDLTKLEDPQIKCTSKGLRILIKNDKATRGAAHCRTSRATTLRRIDRIVHEFMLYHALECKSVYPKKFKESKHKLDSKKLGYTEALLDEVMLSKMPSSKQGSWIMKCFRNSNQDCSPAEVTREITSLSSRQVAEIAYETLKELAADDPNKIFLNRVLDETQGAWVIDKDMLQDLITKYYLEPCKYYMQSVGPEIFEPAIFDSVMLGPSDMLRMSDQETVDFHYGWVRYRLCKRLIKVDKDRFVGNIVAMAKRSGKLPAPGELLTTPPRGPVSKIKASILSSVTENSHPSPIPPQEPRPAPETTATPKPTPSKITVTQTPKPTSAPTVTVEEYVDSAIAAKPIVIFSKSYCPFCAKAIKMFKNLKVSDEYLHIIQFESHPQWAEIQTYLKEKTGALSVPRIFINGECIGGYNDALDKLESGELAKLVEKYVKI